MATLYGIPDWHLEALEWFERHEGQTFSRRPFDVGLPVKITSLQKGIWKPASTPYALSVVQTHKGVYEDHDPIPHDDGTWTYFYHQQGQSEEEINNPTMHYANVALMQCQIDEVPVGVIIPSVTGEGYEVLGLAYVQAHHNGYFTLIGPVSLETGRLAVARDKSSAQKTSLITDAWAEFDPNAEVQEPIKILREVSRRQGAPRFRKALLRAYDGHCAMTSYEAPDALEAAHIIPYRGPQTNHPTNGLLLRADMHTLFDLGLVAVDTKDMSLLLAAELVGTKYEQYHGGSLRLPSEEQALPNVEALNRHRQASRVA